MTDKRTPMQVLQAAAKDYGINTFQMSAADILEALDGGSREPSDTTEPAPDHDPGGRDERPTTREETGRRARVPLGTMRTKLDFQKRPGYHRHLFDGRSQRIHDAQRAGYEFVEEMIEGRKVKVSVQTGTREDGSARVDYLMEIRQEFYDHDQAIKQLVVDEIDAAILSGEPRETGQSEPGKYYTPGEGTSMTPGSRS